MYAGVQCNEWRDPPKGSNAPLSTLKRKAVNFEEVLPKKVTVNEDDNRAAKFQIAQRCYSVFKNY